jgi:hypothetical protein
MPRISREQISNADQAPAAEQTILVQQGKGQDINWPPKRKSS